LPFFAKAKETQNYTEETQNYNQISDKFEVTLPRDVQYYNQVWNESFSFSNPAKVENIKRHIKFDPPAPFGPNFPADEESIRYIFLGEWNLSPDTLYTITITEFEDVYGKKLQNPGVYKVRVGRLLPNFHLIKGDQLVHTIESKMKQYIPILFSNLTEVDMEYGSFDLDELIQMNVNQKNIFSAINTKKTRWKTNGPKNQYYKTSLDLKPYLQNQKGFLGIRLQSPVIELKEIYNSQTRSYETQENPRTKAKEIIVQSTDLALSVREDYANSYIWATSLSTAKPQSGVTISFYQDSNLSGVCSTDPTGYCTVPKQKQGYDRPSMYYAKKGNEDKSFLLSKYHEIYEYYVNPDAYKQAHAELFFDRKLYRPGDMVFIKAVVTFRDKGELKPYSGNIKIKISDPTGTTVHESTKSTSKEGGIWLSYKISGEAKLGHYNVHLSSVDGLSSRDTFQVEEFRPVSFAVDVMDVSKGNNTTYQITGKYLFGAPMRGARVSYSIFRNSGYLDYPDFYKYHFGVNQDYDLYDYDFGGYYSGGDDGSLDENGVFVFHPDLSPQKDTIEAGSKTISYSIYTKYRIQATIRDKDDKSVTKTKLVEVFPGEFSIGVYSVDSYHKYDEKFLFDIVGVDKTGKAVSNKEVNIYIVQNIWNSVKEMGVSGHYYNNKIQKKIVYDTSLKLKQGPTRFEYKPSEPGSYDLIVQERNGGSLTSYSFYGSKENYYSSWNFRSDDTIELTSDRKTYKPGDKAKVLIKSPFPEARAIVTLEREKVYWQKSFDLKGNSIPIEVPILDEHLPNVFLNVMLIRPRMKMPDGLEEEEKKMFAKEDLGIPKIKIGRVKLRVDISSKTANLEISSDKKIYSPGSKVKLVIKTEPNAELGVSVADRGVLDLVDYSYKNPSPFFYSNWDHGVKMFDIRDSLIRQLNIEPKGNSPGGGGDDYMDHSGSGGFPFDSEDGSRKNFKYTAFWEPGLYANSSGIKEIEFNLPDNLTTFKIMVIASKNGKYNAKNYEIIVKKPVVVQGILPRFVRANDKLEMGALVINETGKDVEMKVDFDSSSFETTQNTKTVKISKNKSSEITFPVTIREEFLKSKTLKTGLELKGSITAEPVNGEALVNSGFTKDEIRDKLYFSIPFKESTQSLAFGLSGYTDGDTKFSGDFPSSKSVLYDQGELQVSLSNSALLGLDRAFKFYEANPYFCLEQRASAYLLAITSGELLKEFSFQPPDKYSYDFKNIDKLFNKEMEEFQNEDGSFRLWKPMDSYGYPYLTSYVAMVMQIAKEKGHKINNVAFEKALKYLANYPKNPKEEFNYELENFSLIYYVLTKENKDTASLEKTLTENLAKLSLRAKAYLAMGISHKAKIESYKDNPIVQKIVEDILQEFEIKNGSINFKVKKSFYGYFSYYTDASELGILLRLLLKLDKENPSISKIVEVVLGMKSNSYWSESHGTGNLALALREYRTIFEISNSDFVAKFKVKNTNLIDEKFPAKSVAVYNKKFPYGDFRVEEKTSMPFSIEKPNQEGRLYYFASLKYTSKEEDLKQKSNGISLSRTIQDDSGSNVSPNGFERGKVYTVEIEAKIDAPDSNFIIVDRIPSTMEIVNSSFQTEENRSTAENIPWYERSKANIEYRDDKVVITENYINGNRKYKYFIRPLVRGESIFPSGETFLMYKPNVQGRSEGFKTTVK
jgi:uncharacterized protein YfaS (alpha-2-macroglobulin family)